MVKFSRQLEAQMIPEWKDAFVNYRQLKKNVKKIKLSRPDPDAHDAITNGSSSIFDPIRHVAARLSGKNRGSHLRHPSFQFEEEEVDDVELVHSSRDEEVGVFFEKLDEQLLQVDRFYNTKEAEFVERGEVLGKQLQILVQLKQILRDRRCRLRGNDSSVSVGSRHNLSHCDSPFSVESGADTDTSETQSPMSELVDTFESDGMKFMGLRVKGRKAGKPRTSAYRIDIPATTPTRTISVVTSMLWEDVVNGSESTPRKEGGDSITRKKIQCAEKMIRNAYVELYRGLGLLNTFSSLNMMAFRKIMKKFDKVANKQESGTYLQKVKSSSFVSSDKVMRLGDEVESIFIEHFANKDRKKAMNILRPQPQKDSHAVTFFVGLFTGSFVTLFVVYAILAHLSGLFSSTNDGRYMEIVYPIFSMFALISLHIFLYGCNIYAWRRTRINHNFIFEFSPQTALKHRDAFLISSSFMTVVVGAMVVHLLLISAGISPRHVDDIPGILLLMFLVLLVCPFNICYRSTRYCFLRVIRNIILSPLYRVYMVDFFMADQLTSQIPLMRYMEFTSCFFMAGGFKPHSYSTCTNSRQYKQLSYIISLLPYFWRAMQCFRRYMEEGYDLNHIANAGKYASAFVAAGARMKYAVDPSPACMAVVIVTSTFATMYQLYWDFVKDWGFFCKKSRNPWLRDDLVLKNKSIYYFSIALNLVLRLVWIQSVTHLNLGKVENRLLDFVLASLEVTRRGHWNFYRLENEHLNNVGKFRAVKAVPLPFQEIDAQ